MMKMIRRQYCWPVLLAIREANLLYITDADGPQPPVAAKAMGGKSTMLNLPDVMFILSPLPSFVLLVGRQQGVT